MRPMDMGLLARKHVNVVEHVYIGKESRDIKEALLEESGDTIGHYTDSDTPEYSRTGVAGFVATVGAAELARRAGISRRTLNDTKHGARPSGRTRRAILARMRPESVDNGPAALRDEVCERIRAYGPARLARESKVGRRTIYDMLNGAIPRVRTLKRVMAVIEGATIRRGSAVPKKIAA